MNPLLQSGIALAGANRKRTGPGEEDGILTAEEIASLNLDGVEWAVLSACDTGLGAVKDGEGVFGFRRAFQLAGRETVIMSYGPSKTNPPVSDEWTLPRTAGAARNDGRRRKARERGHSQGTRAKGLTTHPFYWAAFVAAGDWR